MAFVVVNEKEESPRAIDKIEFGNLKITFHEMEGEARIVVWPKPKCKLSMSIVEDTLTIGGISCKS